MVLKTLTGLCRKGAWSQWEAILCIKNEIGLLKSTHILGGFTLVLKDFVQDGSVSCEKGFASINNLFYISFSDSVRKSSVLVSEKETGTKLEMKRRVLLLLLMSAPKSGKPAGFAVVQYIAYEAIRRSSWGATVYMCKMDPQWWSGSYLWNVGGAKLAKTPTMSEWFGVEPEDSIEGTGNVVCSSLGLETVSKGLH